MTTVKKLGIWMDHASAHLMEFTADPIATATLDSRFTHQEKSESLIKSESLSHNKEQHQQAAYYKHLGSIIKIYDEVMLFGPTDAKKELFNSLTTDHHFSKIKIEVKQTDKMTEHQQHAYVKDHFPKHGTAI